jgi:tetratricopeptide (TPR) repeat protein
MLASLAWLSISRNDSTLAMACVWMVAPILPATNIFFPVATVMGERLLYTPSVGFLMLAVHATDRVIWRPQIPKQLTDHTAVNETSGTALCIRVCVVCCVIGSLVCGAVRSHARCHDWRSEEALFSAAVQTQPQSARAHYNLGSAIITSISNETGGEKHLTKQRQRSAVGAFLRALEIDPTYDQAWNNAGAAYEQLGEHDRAVWAYTVRKQSKEMDTRNKEHRTNRGANTSFATSD